MRQPNILLIMSDQQRWDSLGCNGNVFVHTPNIDRLAGRGVRFGQFYTVQPICTPARGTMWTGVYPHRHRITGNVYGVDDAISLTCDPTRTLFHRLRQAGYETAYFGKWHLGERDPGLFDEWGGFNSLGGHWVDGRQSMQGGTYIPRADTDRAIRFLRQRADSRHPFLLVTAFYPPHDPFTAPAEFTDLYRGKGVPFAGYYGAVSALDAETGRLMDTLATTGLDRDTVVIYYSDHGETFRYRHGFSHKETCTDDSIRIPFIVHAPGRVAEGHVTNEFCGLQDLMPTLLELAGCPPAGDMHGRSLVPLLRGERAAGWRDCSYVQNTTRRCMTLASVQPWHTPVVGPFVERAIRTQRWKLILSDGPCALYDLSVDPEEELNIYGAPREDNYDQYRHFPPNEDIVRDLAARLGREAAAIGDDDGMRLAEDYVERPIRPFDWDAFEAQP